MSNLLEKASIVLTPTAYSDGTLHSVKPLKTLGSELITNGDFATDSNWTEGTGWTISGGTANQDGTNGILRQNNVVSTNTKVKATFDLTNYGGSGNLTLKFAPTSYPITLTGNGSYTVFTNGTNSLNGDLQIITSGGFVGSIGNVSVKEVIDADFDFTRGTAATRVNSQGLIEDVQILSGELVQNGDFEQIGSELVTNGDFATDSDWTLESGWSISNGKLLGTLSNSTNAYQAEVLEAGRIYQITYEISNYSQGGVRFQLAGGGGTVSGTSNLSNGVFTETLKATVNHTSIRFRSLTTDGGFTGSIDNVSVKEVGQNWTLEGGWSVENGLLVNDGTGVNLSATQSGFFTIGNKYRVSLDVKSITQGSLEIYLGFPQSDIKTINSSGSYTYDIIASGNTTFYIKPLSNFTGSIDNISVIEITDDTDLPRINYLGGTGHILLEPSSTNKYTYSEDFSQGVWNKTNATVSTSTITDPTGGQNSFKLVSDSGTGGNRSLGGDFTGLSGLHTQSVFAKKGEYDYIMLRARNAPNTGVMFDLENGTFNVNLTSAAFDSAKIEDYGDGWFRCSMTLDPSQMTTSGQIYTSFSVGITGSETNSFNGDGISGIYVFGAQFEEQSFPTSYIPTSNGTASRSADAAINSGSSDLINSTEGVLYAEIASLNDSPEQPMFISISNAATRSDTVEIGFNNITNTCRFRIRVNSSTVFNAGQLVGDVTQFTKIAIKYKSGDIKCFINGAEVATNTTSFSFTSPLSELNFDRGDGGGNFLLGKVKSVAVFKEALTDEELTCLTT